MKISVSGKLLAMLSECYSKCFSKKNKMDITKEKFKEFNGKWQGYAHGENKYTNNQEHKLEKQNVSIEFRNGKFTGKVHYDIIERNNNIEKIL
jgi:hypothetical protein